MVEIDRIGFTQIETISQVNQFIFGDVEKKVSNLRWDIWNNISTQEVIKNVWPFSLDFLEKSKEENFFLRVLRCQNPDDKNLVRNLSLDCKRKVEEGRYIVLTDILMPQEAISIRNSLCSEVTLRIAREKNIDEGVCKLWFNNQAWWLRNSVL